MLYYLVLSSILRNPGAAALPFSAAWRHCRSVI